MSDRRQFEDGGDLYEVVDELDEIEELLPAARDGRIGRIQISSASTTTASGFLYLPTIWIQLFQFALLILFLVMCFVSLPQEDNNDARLRGYSVRSTFHVALFLVSSIVQASVHYCHRRARLGGYLALYRNVRLSVLIAPVVLSVGNSILVLVSNLWPSDDNNEQVFTSLNMLQLLVTVEVAIISPLLCFYMNAIRIHNSDRKPPDAQTGQSLKSGIRLTTNQMMSTESEPEEDLLTQQGEVIQYLQTQNHHLSQQVLILSQEADAARAQLSSQDQPHRLVVKDQQIRALTAECDLLQTKLSDAAVGASSSRELLELRDMAQQLSKQLDESQRELHEWKKQHAQLKLLFEVEKESHEVLKQEVAARRSYFEQ